MDDFGNVDYYDGLPPIRDLLNGDDSTGGMSPSASGEANAESTSESYQGQFGSISTAASTTSFAPHDSSAILSLKDDSTSPVSFSSSPFHSAETLPHPSQLKSVKRPRGGGGRRVNRKIMRGSRGQASSSVLSRMAKNVRDVSCVGVPFTTIPGRRLYKKLYNCTNGNNDYTYTHINIYFQYMSLVSKHTYPIGPDISQTIRSGNR